MMFEHSGYMVDNSEKNIVKYLDISSLTQRFLAFYLYFMRKMATFLNFYLQRED